jgi:hypothetical protein
MADEELDVPQRALNTEDIRVVRDKPPRRSRKWLWITLLSVLGAPAAIFALWAVITLSYSYSTGDRAGYIQKFSKKGWICKTWEGELAMTTVPGTAPQLFEFSVRDDSIAAVIEEIMRTREGRVSLSYEQHKGVPTDCFGETDYFVVQARPVGPDLRPSMPASSAPTAPAAPMPSTATP